MLGGAPDGAKVQLLMVWHQQWTSDNPPLPQLSVSPHVERSHSDKYFLQ